MKLSIIVTAHKGTEPYFDECIKSIMAQTTDAYEVIVVVDGYDKPMIYPGTTTLIRDANMGVAHSRNQAVKVATGDWLLFLDGDDVLTENFIDEMKAQARWKKADIFYPSTIIWSMWGDSKLKNGYFSPPQDLKLEHFEKQNYVVVTSLMKREVFDMVGGFDEDLILFEDYKFFFEAFLMGYKFSKSTAVLKYRQRTQSRNRANEIHKKRIYEQIKRDLIGRYPSVPKYRTNKRG